MGTYRCDDDELSYRESGDGKPVIVIPGGPGRNADYLEKLGGLDRYADRRLIVMEPRGTGATPAPLDHARYAASSLATDLGGLRSHFGLDRIELIAHSAGCAVAFIYAAQHPQRIRRLVLLNPSTRAIGLEDTDQEWEAQQAKRRHEPWFLDARTALVEIETEGPTPERRQRMSPLLYGTWDARAQKHAASDATQRNMDATRGFWRDEPSPAGIRAALAAVDAPVRILRGELDMGPGPVLAAEVGSLFRDGRVTTQPGAGHFPWVDDPDRFVELMNTTLLT